MNSVLTKIKEVTELLQGTFCRIFSFSFCEEREPGNKKDSDVEGYKDGWL